MRPVPAATALASTGDPTSVKTLSEALARDPAMEVRVAAAQGLGNVPNTQSTEALVRILREEKDVGLRFHASASLQKITGRELPPSAPEWEQYLRSRPATADGRLEREPGSFLRHAGWLPDW